MGRIFIYLCCLFLSLDAWAQYSFSGRIIDCSSQQPLVGATVEFVSLKRTIQTNGQGYFLFDNLPKGTYPIYISQEGYKGKFFRITLKKSEKNYTFAICKDKEIEVEEITVTATRTEKNLKNVPITVQVITSEDIRKSQATNFQTFLENEFSGINFTYRGNSSPDINMMGFGGKYVLFLVDGERMGGESFDNIDYDRINLDNVERIEIIKGASSSLYGSNALGGVINIITKNSQKPIEINAGYLYDTNKDHKIDFTIGSKQKWGNIRLSSFYKLRTPYWLTDTEGLKVTYPDGRVVEGEKGKINIAGFTIYSVSPKIGFDFSPKLKLSFTPTYYFSERNPGTEISNKIRDRYYDYSLAMNAKYLINENKELSFSGSFDHYEKYDYFVRLKEKEKNYESTIWKVGSQYNQALYGKHSLVAGIEANSDGLMSFRFNNEGTSTKQNAYTYSLFTQQDWALSPAFTLVTGLRMDYHSLFKEYFTYRLSGMFKIEEFTFRGGYSTGFRSPTLKELYTNWFHAPGGGFQIMGNKKLQPETSNNFNFSVELNTKKWNVTAMTQYSVVTDKIAYVWTQSNDTLHYTNFSGKTGVIGSEVSATYRPIHALRFKASYAYYNIEKRKSEERPHTFTLKAEYIPVNNRKYIPNVLISGKYVSANHLYGTDNGSETYSYYEPYSIWRLQLSSKLPYKMTISAGINNLLGYQSKTNTFYSSISPGRTYYAGLKWNL